MSGKGATGLHWATVATRAKRDAGRKKARAGTSPAASGGRGARKPAARARRPAAPAESPAPATPAALDWDASALAPVEPAFAARVPAPAPERPRPAGRRAVFLDVENTSKPQHLARVIDHLALNHRDSQTDVVAVANWKVVGHDAARLLAQRGAHLVHSAPSTGVRDWSDLRLAVSAGIWLAGARPGDRIEIISDDRAFDAVGDVAASLGIEFRRSSYRQLVKEEAAEPLPAAPRPEAAREAGSRRRRRHRGWGGRVASGPGPHEPRRREPAVPPPAAAPAGAEPARPRAIGGHAAGPCTPRPAHTAPHDESVSVVRESVEASPQRVA